MPVGWIDPTQGCATLNPAEVFLTEDLEVLVAVLDVPVEAARIIQKVVRQGDTLSCAFQKLNSPDLLEFET